VLCSAGLGHGLPHAQELASSPSSDYLTLASQLATVQTRAGAPRDRAEAAGHSPSTQQRSTEGGVLGDRRVLAQPFEAPQAGLIAARSAH